MPRQMTKHMPRQYFSIKEAVDLTGVSEASIRRLCKGAKNDNIQYKGGKLFILNSFLFSKYPAQNLPKQDENLPRHMPKQMTRQGGSNIELIQDVVKEYSTQLLNEKDQRITYLEQEIAVKNRQLEKKDEIIEKLNHSNELISERLRETNINLQTIQQTFNKVINQLPESTAKEDKQVQLTSKTNRLLYVMATLATALMALMLIAIGYRYFTQ
jgi:Mg2+ and Co2+ transporter CorA